MKTVVWNSLSESERKRALERPAVANAPSVEADVRKIIDDVRSRGDDAIADLTQQLDGVRLDTIQVTSSEIESAFAKLTKHQRDALATAKRHIESFHTATLPVPIRVETAPGVVCERIARPIDTVGLYVPAGTAPLPSTALMLAVPAALAGCANRVLCVPPRPDGTVEPSVLVAASMCDTQCIIKAGGAQAIAAMAYGTQSVPKVDKIFGPGNTWVTTAKMIVSLDPSGAACDLPAGPSEVLVIADAGADPSFVAADLLSQAEHGPDSQVILVTDSIKLADQVEDALQVQLATLPRKATAAEALGNSVTIIVENVTTAFEVSNRYAPEHLIVNTAEPRKYLDLVRSAGSVFLGRWTPESVGDYCSGTNHVLPTYGHARAHSGLGVEDFMTKISVQELSEAGLGLLQPTVETLAEMEGLAAHARAVQIRCAVGEPAGNTV